MRLSVAFLLIITASAGHTENLPLDEKIRAAMAAEIRTEADVVRDGNRRPVETLSFFGLRDDMRVLELLPGGGWYTKILAPVLRDNGELHVAIGTGRVRDNLLNEDGFDKVNVIEVSAAMPSDGEFGARTVGMFAFDAGEFDLVLTFRNLHSFMGRGYELELYQAAYDALKPGGVFGVIEHRGLTDEPQDPEAANGYVREDYAIERISSVGFELQASSDINNNPKDTKDYARGVWALPPTLRNRIYRRDFYLSIGESDRFTLRFVKPEAQK